MKRLSVLIACLVIVFSLASGAQANFVSNPLSGAQQRFATPVGPIDQGKIDRQVLTALSQSGGTKFFIILAEKADLQSASQIADWDMRGWHVYNALQETAQRSQAPLIAQLKAQEVPYRSFFIINAILVEQGGLQLAMSLAARQDVVRILPDQAFEVSELFPDRQNARAPNSGLPLIKAEPELVLEPNIAWIGSTLVWSQGWTGQNITVANIDSGVQYEHPALVKKFRGNLGGGQFSGDYNWRDFTGECGGSALPCDNNGHGTYTMGIIVGDAEGDDFRGIIGVAPGSRWITAKACKQNGSCLGSDILLAAQWMLAPTRLDGSDADPTKRPQVVNNSWSGTGGDSWFMSWVDSWRAAGIFAVFSNGNSGLACNTVGSPADYPQAFGVGAVTYGYSPDNIWLYSSRGPSAFGVMKPDISAPGMNVDSAWPAPPGAPSYQRYRNEQGTSVAAPHVAGVVALLWSAYPTLRGQIDITRNSMQAGANHNLNLDLISLCGPSGWPNNVYGYGYINAWGAYNVAGKIVTDQTPPTTTPAISPLPHLGWNGTAVTVTLHAEDGADGSGVRSITYQASGAQSIPLTTVYMDTATIQITANGETILDFIAEDNAGNVEGHKTLPIKIDPIMPSCFLNSRGINDKGQVTISIFVQDYTSGLDMVNPVIRDNIALNIPPFSQGETGIIFLTATQNNPSQPPDVRLEVTDVAQNTTICEFNPDIFAGTPGEFVTTNTDDGYGSLRRLLAYMSPSSTIHFTFSLNTTITFNRALNVNKSAKIHGPGRNILTLSGNKMTRLITVSPLVPVEITQMTLTRGLVHQTTSQAGLEGGGAIYNKGNLLLSGVSIGFNEADFGGGIANVGIMTLTDSLVVENRAPVGAGIQNSGTLTITSSTITSNRTGGAGDGGGIYNDGILHLSQVLVTNNSARGGGGILNWDQGQVDMTATEVTGNTAGNGGGIENGDHGFVAISQNSNISSNTATNAGGGIANYATGLISVTSSSIYNNQSTASPGNNIGGGGIYNFDGGEVTVTSSVVLGNKASYGAGFVNQGIATIDHTTFADNESVFDGGGVFNTGSLLTLTDSSFHGNNANGGGGLLNWSSGHAEILRCTFDDNTADMNGGAIEDGVSGVVSITNSTFSGNSAVENGGAIAVFGNGLVELSNATLTANTAKHGGAVNILETGQVKATQTIIALNPVGGNCAAVITSLGYNLESENTCGFHSAGDLINTDPLLSPLADHGGATLTHALLPGSPAIDACRSTTCPATDQRGAHRPLDGNGDGVSACDIGAYEAPTRIFLPKIMKGR